MLSRIFTLILLLVALKAAAQREAAPRGAAQRDLIITQAGEQIRCRIVDESSMRFTYIYVNEKGKQVKTEIFKTLISSFKYNYFPGEVISGKKDADRQTVTAKADKQQEAGRDKKGRTPVAENPAQTAAGKENKRAREDIALQKETPKKEEDRKEALQEESARKETAQKEILQEEAARKETVQQETSRKEEKSVPAEKTVVAENRVKVPPAAKVPTEKEPAGEEYVSPLKGKTEFTNYLKYRVGFKGGLGNIIDENTDKSPFGLFNEKLRRGWVYGIDAAVFLNDHIGVGITYQSYQSRNKNASLNSEVPLESGGSLPIRSLESKVNHKFVGPTLLGRVGMDYKTFIVATVSPGYYFYSDKGMVNQMNYEYKGGVWGGAATLGIDFLIGNNETGRDVILSFECGYNYGQLKSLKPENGWNKLPIGLNRLDFAVGLRFTRFPRYLR